MKLFLIVKSCSRHIVFCTDIFIIVFFRVESFFLNPLLHFSDSCQIITMFNMMAV